MSEVFSPIRIPLVDGNKTFHDISSDICEPLERKTSRLWWYAFLPAATVFLIGIACVLYQIKTGIGTWGLDKTIGWAFDITNFVFWIGIGHAGTLISAVLFLTRQKWRTGINRSAEAMTIFAVMCAGIFPLIHMGRPWLAHYVFPVPNHRGPLWPNPTSPLLWDVFAVSTYFTISLLFWYTGLIPDIATARDRAKDKLRKFLYTIFALGWNGSARTWGRYEIAYMIFAGISTPLVFSVHSVVSFDFATSILPGWHTTIFPPYFVIGAVFSGFGMVLMLLLMARGVMPKFKAYITPVHLENMCKIILVTGSLVGLAYGTEFFIAWYSGSPYEGFTFLNRAFGPMAWSYWIMVSCNVISPQLFWFKKFRTSVPLMFFATILVNIGMWFERFVIIVTSLHRDFLPSSWSEYTPTWIEIGTLLGSFGMFFTLFLLFCRALPMIAIGEVKSVMKFAKPSTHPVHAHTGSDGAKEVQHV